MRRTDWLRWIILGALYAALAILLVALISGALFNLALAEFFGPKLSAKIRWPFEVLLEYWRINSDLIIDKFKWLSAIATTLTGGYALLNAWHYLESELPRRLKELLDRANAWDRKDRAGLLEQSWLAGSDDSFALTAPEASAVYRFLSEIRSEAIAPRTRWLAASANALHDEWGTLQKAYELAQHRTVTAHLVKGRQLSGFGNDTSAMDEYRRALDADPSDLEALNMAAACARRLQREAEELGWLKQMEATSQKSPLMAAKGMRRQAELLLKTSDSQQWQKAQQLLDEAIRVIGNPSKNSGDAFLERGRLLTLFCEARIKRDKRGYLNSRANSAIETLKGQAVDVTGPFEEGGEKYGYQRAQQMMEALNSDTPSSGDDE
jgi:tetratricopeptide (TPR) repeat protein